MVLPALSDETLLKVTGILEELPEGVSFDQYHDDLKKLQHTLEYLPRGTAGAAAFEDFVGELIKLCFFRSLTNVQAKVRNHNGAVIRDWIASNRAAAGFWEVVRSKYGATQVIWECKNYEQLHADDFHQAGYYMNEASGRFVVIAFRGTETEDSYYRHIERLAAKQRGLVLLLTEKDIRVFIRQALNGKFKEDHISELFDRTVRAVS
jgi:hypothetical protein